MRLTKVGHACVRLEKRRASLNDVGLGLVDGLLGYLAENRADMRRPQPGEAVDVT